MQIQDQETLQALLRFAVSNAIMNAKDSIVLHENTGNGFGVVVYLENLQNHLANNFETSYTILCTVRATGKIEESAGNIILKHGSN